MIAVAQKMEYVIEDSVTHYPTTIKWRDQTRRVKKTPEFIKSYIEDAKTSDKPSIVVNMLLECRDSKRFREDHAKMMYKASKQYDDWDFPDYVIGMVFTIIFKFPTKWGIPDWLVWESSINTYTREMSIGLRRDMSLGYERW
jgi:hypothetical protein